MKIIEKVLQLEGGLVNDPADSGGITNFGITLPFLRQFQKTATEEDIKSLTKEAAIHIYLTLFSISKTQLLPMPLQPIFFDTVVMSGAKKAVVLLQRTLNLPCYNSGQYLLEDGILGEKTLNELLKIWEDFGLQVVNSYADIREEFFNAHADISPAKEKFLKGWIKRNNSYRVEV